MRLRQPSNVGRDPLIWESVVLSIAYNLTLKKHWLGKLRHPMLGESKLIEELKK